MKYIFTWVRQHLKIILVLKDASGILTQAFHVVFSTALTIAQVDLIRLESN